MKWESVFPKAVWDYGTTRRRLQKARVPTGWLVIYREFTGSAGWAMHDITHVPDPEGVWASFEDMKSLETIYSHGNPNFDQRTSRLKTPGGWLVIDNYLLARERRHSHVCMTYVPDEGHEWNPQAEDQT
jgi:hypothetical protein